MTAANASRAYGAANPAFTGTITGQQNGDTFTFAATPRRRRLRSAGTYAIVPTATGTNLANYTVVYNNGTLTVGQGNPDGDGSERQPRLRRSEPGLYRDDYGPAERRHLTFAATHDGDAELAPGHLRDRSRRRRGPTWPTTPWSTTTAS